MIKKVAAAAVVIVGLGVMPLRMNAVESKVIKPVLAITADNKPVIYGGFEGIVRPGANIRKLNTAKSKEVKGMNLTPCYAAEFKKPDGTNGWQVACMGDSNRQGFGNVFTTDVKGTYCNLIGTHTDKDGKTTSYCDDERCEDAEAPWHGCTAYRTAKWYRTSKWLSGE